MTLVYGGMFLENIVNQDHYFAGQMKLYELGLIDGAQIRIGHPSFTSNCGMEDAEKIFDRLPEKFATFIHFGCDNVGADLGQTFNLGWAQADLSQKADAKWHEYNRQTIRWGMAFAANRRNKHLPKGVIHAGNGLHKRDSDAYCRLLQSLHESGSPKMMAIEALPPIVDLPTWASLLGQDLSWMPQKKYWQFGNTPEDMKELLAELGPGWKCLLDFSHLIALKKQAHSYGRVRELWPWRTMEKIIEAYLALPICDVCHWSGITEVPVAYHDNEEIIPPPLIKEAINKMSAVCLEIPFYKNDFETNCRQVEQFKESISTSLSCCVI